MNMQQERLWTLLGKKMAGLATAEELQELELLQLAHGEDAGTIEIIERMWTSRNNTPSANEPVRNRISDALGFSLETQPTVTLPPSPRKPRLNAWLIGAATVCIGGLLWFQLIRQKQGAAKEQALNVLFTRKKSHSNLQLPDGTLVVVNENSRISYNADFGQTKREIILEGEAYFDVAKDADIPFIIHAGNVDIRILGTTVNVKAYPGDKQIETSLLKGAVEVSSKLYPQKKLLLRPNEKIAIPTTIPTPTIQDEPDSNAVLIHPSSSASVNRLPPDETAPADTLSYQLQPLKKEHTSRLIPEIAWIYRKLVFNHESLASVAEKMERWYDVHIYFEDDKLKNENFTGSFDKETLEQALNELQYTYHFSFIIKKNEVFIKSK